MVSQTDGESKRAWSSGGRYASTWLLNIPKSIVIAFAAGARAEPLLESRSRTPAAAPPTPAGGAGRTRRAPAVSRRPASAPTFWRQRRRRVVVADHQRRQLVRARDVRDRRCRTPPPRPGRGARTRSSSAAEPASPSTRSPSFQRCVVSVCLCSVTWSIPMPLASRIWANGRDARTSRTLSRSSVRRRSRPRRGPCPPSSGCSGGRSGGCSRP